MADTEAEGEEAAPPKRKIELQTLLVLLNSLLVLAAVGTAVYTKLMFEKPPLVEEVELEKKKDELKTPATPVDKVMVAFDPMTVNVATTSGKAHFATLGFAVECRDQGAGELVQAKKAILLDKIVQTLGKRQVTQLNTIQGKLLLKTDLIRQFNSELEAGAVTDLYFSSFVLQ